MEDIEVPCYFLCPISLEIMKDPVIISTGITYDRESIERWLFSQKNDTCPVTKQILLDTDSTPNITLRRLIQSWCIVHSTQGFERLPTPKSPVAKSKILKILDDCSVSQQMQITSLQKLKSFASQNQTNKRRMEAVGVHQFLASLIVNSSDETSLSILYSLQLSKAAMKTLIQVEFIESLVSLLCRGNDESRVYSVSLLQSILDETGPDELIHLSPEFFTQLTRILNDQVCPKASKAALKALITACPWGRNRVKAAEAGAVGVLINLLLDCSDKKAIEMILIALDMLCQVARGRAELLDHGAGLAVVSKKILRVSVGANERAVRILHSISKFSATPAILREMLQVGVVSKLCLVLQVNSGSKTKESATEILKIHARYWRNSLCIPDNLVSSYPS